MDKIRVMLVDDAAVVRRLVGNALNRDADLEVVGTAADGRMALDRLNDLRPDVVLLDLEMPVLDGLQTLVALRKSHPRLPVIMFSRFTQRGVEATVHALTLGADDYVPKPGDGLDVSSCIEQLLIPKIKLLVRPPNLVQEGAAQPSAASGSSCRVQSGLQRVEVVAIGTSTGGPNALAELFRAFPADWNAPLLIVQHMPPQFTARLAERLSQQSQLRVHEAAADQPVSAAQAWVAPGDYHLLVRRAGASVGLALNQEAPVHSCRPAVDVLFRSVAEVYGSGVLAVVLTGMGRDGLAGCERVRAAGGQVLVQDQASSVVGSMPGAVADAGLADRILPLKDLGQEIVRRVRQGQSGTAHKDNRRCL
jgi:two-component system, chemotaxis family, protein-glutamate methylesterase/glutaminase